MRLAGRFLPRTRCQFLRRGTVVGLRVEQGRAPRQEAGGRRVLMIPDAGGVDGARSLSLADDFRRDGAVCVRGAFSAEEVALVERGIERNLAAPSPRAIVASRPDDPGRFVEDFCNWQAIPEYEEFVRGSDAAALAGELMGSDRVRLFHDHVLVKEPGTSQRTPWHQDQPYYNVEGKQVVSMWMPVDPVARELDARVRRRLPPRALADAEDLPGRGGEVVSGREPRGAPRHRRRPRPLPHPRVGARARRRRLLPHAHAARGRAACRDGAGAVRSPCASSATMPRTLPRPWKTSPDFPGLADELPAGAPMEHPLFPVLWERGPAGA